MCAARRQKPTPRNGPADLLTDRRPVRLNRYLAAAGLGSRRAVESLITDGRVTIGGTVVTKPGTHVLPGRDRVTVDGERVELVRQPIYLMLHKPPGVLTTVDDPHHRRTVIDLLRHGDRARRLFPVGRLDRESEGLVLLTNDGTLAHRLLHPRYHVAKRYRVWTDPSPHPKALRALSRGVSIAPRVVTRPAQVRTRGRRAFDITLEEGKKRQIRLMCEALGLRVTRLVRLSFGPLKLDELPSGAYRRLDRGEIEALWQAAGLGGRLEAGDAGAEAGDAGAEAGDAGAEAGDAGAEGPR
jgi:pseudouridine synthase